MRFPKGSFVPIVSLILLAGCCYGYWVQHNGNGTVVAIFGKGGRVGGLVSSRGQALLVITNVSIDARRAWTMEVSQVGDRDAHALVDLLTGRAVFAKQYGTFALLRGKFDEIADSGFVAVGVPHAVLVGLIMLPALPWIVRRWRGWRRRRAGLCLSCGYDLRHSPGRCPECGWERAPCPTEVGKPA